RPESTTQEVLDQLRLILVPELVERAEARLPVRAARVCEIRDELRRFDDLLRGPAVAKVAPMAGVRRDEVRVDTMSDQYLQQLRLQQPRVEGGAPFHIVCIHIRARLEEHACDVRLQRKCVAALRGCYDEKRRLLLAIPEVDVQAAPHKLLEQ